MSSMINYPFVSIIIPALNVQAYIVACLESLLAQDYPKDKYEIIVVDNGSCDRTVELVQKYAVKLLIKPNVNIASVRNWGAQQARGDVLAFMDADCLARPDWLTEAVSLLELDNVGATGCWYALPHAPHWIEATWDLLSAPRREKIGPVDWIPSSNFIIKRKVFDAIKGFDEQLTTAEDVDISKRVLQTGAILYAHPKLAVRHLDNPKSLTRFFFKEQWRGKGVIENCFRQFPKIEFNNALIFALVVQLCVMGILAGLLSDHPKLILISLLGIFVIPFLMTLKIMLSSAQWGKFLPLCWLFTLYGLARASSIFRLIKNKLILWCVVLAILFLFFHKGPEIKQEIKTVVMSTAVKIKHKIEGRPDEPQRFNATPMGSSQAEANIFVASSLDRIFQDGKTLLKPNFTKNAALSLAKNEYGSFQVVVQTGNNELDQVSLDISDLRNEANGQTIAKENIIGRIVGYVPTVQPYYPVKYVGLWPDPLLPAHEINIGPHITQPFWISVYVPNAAAAGDYSGTVTVKANGSALQTIAVLVHVYNFTLPKTSHLKTAFDFYAQLTKIRYPQGANEGDKAYGGRLNDLNDQFIMAMLKYRMNPILNVDPTSQSDLGNVDRYMVYGLNNFSIGHRGGTFGNNWPKSDEDIEALLPIYEGYGEDLKLNQMLDETYIYTWDEGDMGNPQVAKVASMIHRAYPDLKNMVCYHGLWDPDKDGTQWIKDIDIWTFNIDDFNEAKMRKLQALGKEIWMYISGPAGGDTPNLAMDFDSIDYRIIPWLCWKYDIKGFLYWCVNEWAFEDPFITAKNTQWEQNGNGLLFYPGEDGPLPSLRVEIFRDGMEDYEYIQLLFEDLKILKQKNLDKQYKQFFDESVRLLTMDNTIAASLSQFTKDPTVLQARRDAIAQKIEEFKALISS